MVARVFILLAAWLILGPGAAKAQAPTFETLLEEAGAAFQAPAGFTEVAVPLVPRFPFDKALRSGGDDLQVLYAVRPTGRMQIDYNDPHSSAPHPDHIFPLVFETLIGSFSGGGNTPSRRFSDAESKRRFGADWASAAIFNLDPDLFPGYRFGFLVAQHKGRSADLFTLFLFNDPEIGKKRIDPLLAGLAFRPPG